MTGWGLQLVCCCANFPSQLRDHLFVNSVQLSRCNVLLFICGSGCALVILGSMIYRERWISSYICIHHFTFSFKVNVTAELRI